MAQISFDGNIANAELRQAGSAQVCKFTVAENHQKKNKQTGSYEDSGVTFHRVEYWGNRLLTAEALHDAISNPKTMVMVSGKQETEEYVKDGEKKTNVKVTADKVGVLQKAGQGGGGQRSGGFGGQQSYGQQATQQPTWGQGNQGTNTQSWGTQDDDVAPF